MGLIEEYEALGLCSHEDARDFYDRCREPRIASGMFRRIVIASDLCNELEGGQIGSGETKTPPDPPADDVDFVELKKWVKNKLKGKQRRVVELTIEAGGEFAISDLAIDPAIGWETPCDNAFGNICKAVNPKLKKAKIGWRIERNDNKSRLAKVG
jgi:hypothetical protein